MLIFSKPLSLQTYLDIEKYMFVKLYQVHIRHSQQCDILQTYAQIMHVKQYCVALVIVCPVYCIPVCIFLFTRVPTVHTTRISFRLHIWLFKFSKGFKHNRGSPGGTARTGVFTFWRFFDRYCGGGDDGDLCSGEDFLRG